jgi:outer membrane protein OmpA-like peptidoglycan-associated protein
VGADDANQLLSLNRAKAVVDYLVSQGINAERLTSKGYGETVPIASNETEEGRAKNRRTEFTVTF